MEKIWIYIDWRNFELWVMELLWIKNKNELEKIHKIIDLDIFIKKISIEKTIIYKNFYRWIPKPSLFSKEICKNVGIFVNGLTKKWFKIYKWHFTRKKSEKWVDVRLALDIVRDSRNKDINIVFLFSNDTDLLEAIKDAKLHWVEIYHCIFKIDSKVYYPNNALSVNSHKRLILNRQLLESKI
jgi:uncharacterized LabA/DUF88 family protein